jgi:glycosyltransferase involved in cell wall biosynthesis
MSNSAASNFGSLRGKRAAVVLFADYLTDTRPRREAEALAQLGMKVEVISLKENKDDPLRDAVNGVSILRLPLKHWRGNKLGYVFHYALFTFLSLVLLGFRSLTRRYSIVHVHNMPDFLVFAALVPKAFGAKVILDLHDPMPELMITIFGLEQDSFYVRLLKLLEKGSTWFANLVLTPNIAFERLFAGRGCRADKLQVILNSPDEGIFKYRDFNEQAPAERDPSKPFVIMYHGAIVERHGLDLAVLALKAVRRSIPNAELRIFGVPTSYLQIIMDLARERGLEKAVRYMGAKSLEQIAELIDDCDVGIIPNRRSTFTEINFPTRIFEYLARGKPVIAPMTSGIGDYFTKDELVIFEMGNADDIARKIEFVFLHPRETSAIIKRGQGVYRGHTWSKERARFWMLVSGLLDEHCPALQQTLKGKLPSLDS